MDPRQFLDLAERLLREVATSPDPSVDGAKCRAAFNRAYYAAFLVARELFDALNLRVPNGSKCHSVVQEGLNNSGVSSLVKISEQLGTLYTGRAGADYDMRKRDTENHAQATVNVTLARTLVILLDTIRTGRTSPPINFATVAATMLAWAQGASQPLYRK